LVDKVVQQYTAGLLREWKRLSEEAARLEIKHNIPSGKRPPIDDVDLIPFYAQLLRSWAAACFAPSR